MKQIKTEQIEAVLQVIYSTNIPASQFDALRKLFSELPDIKEPKDDQKK
jgi:hypothetical protein